MGLQKDMLTRQVRELPIQPGILVSPDTTVGEAIRRMVVNGQGSVIVVDKHGKPEGRFSEHQIANLIVNHPGYKDEAVSQHIREYWGCVSLADPIVTVSHKLQTYHQRFVVVVNEEGRAVGVVGQRGLMEYIADHFPYEVKAQSMDAAVAIDNREGA